MGPLMLLSPHFYMFEILHDENLEKGGKKQPWSINTSLGNAS